MNQNVCWGWYYFWEEDQCHQEWDSIWIYQLDVSPHPSLQIPENVTEIEKPPSYFGPDNAVLDEYSRWDKSQSGSIINVTASTTICIQTTALPTSHLRWTMYTSETDLVKYHLNWKEANKNFQTSSHLIFNENLDLFISNVISHFIKYFGVWT